MEELFAHSDLSLAIDESLVQTDWWPNLLPFTSHVIIKPMLLGSFTKIFETNRLANTHDNKTVFTTTLESMLGRTITATLASGLGDAETAHGLNTGRLLAKDLHADFDYIINGNYRLPAFDEQLEITPQQLQKLSAIDIQQ
jgi:O-succinylbenzoate synthase